MANWYYDPWLGSDKNSGDSWTVALTGTDGQGYNSTKFTSATGGFTGMEGRYISISDGSYFRLIQTVVSDTEVTLSTTYPVTGTGKPFRIGGPLMTATHLAAGRVPQAADDVWKIPKTPYCDAVSVGTFTYTSKNAQVTIPASRVKTVDNCESGWLGVTNVTVDHYNSYPALGTYFTRVAPAIAFASAGKMAYCQLGGGSAVDLSAFQGLSFAFRTVSYRISANCLKLCLCSDTAGDTIVDEFTIPLSRELYNLATQQWMPMCIMKDGGGNLSNNIQSIALYATADPTPASVYPQIGLDNIMAVLDISNADHICHASVIAQGSALANDWWGMKNFPDDTHVNLAANWYGGTAGDVATYRRHLSPGPPLLLYQYPDPADPLSHPVTWSGGWNTSNDTLDGVTCWFCYPTQATPYQFYVYDHGQKVKNFIIGSNVEFVSVGNYHFITFEDVYCTACMPATTSYSYFMVGPGGSSGGYDGGGVGWTLKNFRLMGTYYPFFSSFPDSCNAYYYRAASRNWYLENCRFISTGGFQLDGFRHLRGQNVEISNTQVGTNKGLFCTGGRDQGNAYDIEFNNLTLRDNGAYTRLGRPTVRRTCGSSTSSRAERPRRRSQPITPTSSLQPVHRRGYEVRRLRSARAGWRCSRTAATRPTTSSTPTTDHSQRDGRPAYG